METRKAYKNGDAVVVALPKKYREALRIVAGTPLYICIKDRAITIQRAIITPASMAAAPDGATAAEDGGEDSVR